MSTNDYTNEDKAEVTKVKDKVDQTALDETNKNIEGINTAIEKLVPKENINTGIFDPTSNDPAGQKSIEYQIMKADILARVANMMRDGASSSGSVAKTFAYMPQSTLDFSFISAGFVYYGFALQERLYVSCMFELSTKIIEIPYNFFLDKVFSRVYFAVEMFYACYSLVTIGAYNFASFENLFNAFGQCKNLKHIHIKNLPVSFDISASIAFEENDLVEILNNLMDMTGKTSQTLTMGATNLAKLTDTEKAIATNKNWALA